MDILYTIAGFILLFAGGEVLLKASIAIAGRLGLSALLVSMVVIGFGTSTPELVITLSAALKGSAPMAFGNIVGSNTANVLLILGLSALITPLCCKNRRYSVMLLLFWPPLFCSAGSHSLMFWNAGWAGSWFSSWRFIWVIPTGRKKHRKKLPPRSPHRSNRKSGQKKLGWVQIIILTLASLGSLVSGAWLLVEGATSIATRIGVPESVIGLTLVAIGSSLPELTMAVLAATRKNTDVIIGNIMGSNLFNTLGILGVTAIVTPLPFPEHIAHFDLWIMLGVVALLVPIMRTGHIINRFEGAFFLCLYSAYTVWLYTA
ncbi:MAG: sodium:calcium antiporter [Alphaproteobacteria bacterium]|nr:sodium:calcium antiporter [Alphaproteobacteria bacterium]